MIKKILLLFFCGSLLLFALFTSCYALNQNAILGTWQGDVDLSMADPEVKAQLDDPSTEDRESLASYKQQFFDQTKVTFTADSITISSGSLGEDTSKYKVVSSTDNSVTIQTDGELPMTYVIEVVDANHLKFSQEAYGIRTLFSYLKK